MPSWPERVILVRGLWMPAAAMTVLAARLSAAGYAVQRFGYASVRVSATKNARRLSAFALAPGDRRARATPAVEPRLHLVGHSTGGALLLRALADDPALAARVTRVVLLGTPYADSAAAHALERLPGGRTLLGRTLGEWLACPRPRPAARHEVGVIAGTRGIGFAQLLTRLAQPHDGVVQVAETRVPGSRDMIVMPVAHVELVLSPKVSNEVAAFLRHGRFSDASVRG